MNQQHIIIAAVIVVGLGSILIFNKQKTETKSQSENTSSDSTAQLISPEEFSQLAQDEDSFILDVHIPEQEHILGTDAFIPFDKIQDNADKLPEDKSTPILVYCRSGNMSAQSAKEIVDLGYTNVYDLAGGTNAYKTFQEAVNILPKNRDLGTVIYGDVVTTSFMLSNYTSQPTTITRVSTSCGCTSAEVVDKDLGPFESTVVNVSFDPAVHKDDTDLRELTRTIYIETDNPDFAKLESTITANVIKN